MPRDPLDEERKSTDEMKRLNLDAVGFTAASFRIAEPLVAVIRGPFVIERDAQLVVEVENGFLTFRLEQPDEKTT